MNDSHIKGASSLPKHADKGTSGPVPMRHLNRLGHTNLQESPNGVGKPSTKPTISNGRKGW